MLSSRAENSIVAVLLGRKEEMPCEGPGPAAGGPSLHRHSGSPHLAQPGMGGRWGGIVLAVNSQQAVPLGPHLVEGAAKSAQYCGQFGLKRRPV